MAWSRVARDLAGIVLIAVCWGRLALAAEPIVPRTVAEIADGFDPRAEALHLRLIREWEEEGIVIRALTYHVGVFKGQPARVAAFYGFPKGAVGLPALLHLHGGGQRAFLNEVRFYARRGYACLSINWGGREMEQARPGDLNTDWGAVDPTQQNVPGYFNLRPGEKFLDPVESPRNNNWYLLTLAARRGLTVLERQPEVDPERLGVYGHSMGGSLTIYVSGTDGRVRVAAPSVGGSGFRTQPWELLPEQARQVPNGNLALYEATIGFESYAPLIKAPTLWLGATNDFHGIMDDTYRTGQLIESTVRYAFTPHMNHRFTPEFAVTRPLWLDQHLKQTFEFPGTPESRIDLTGALPRLEVVPDPDREVDGVQIMYSIDADPQARFWRTARAVRSAGLWSAELPLMSLEQPLFAFANVSYRLEQPVEVPSAQPARVFALSSMLHTVKPLQLQQAGLVATDRVESVIDDFAAGWQDWYRLSPDNPHHWEYSTRKVNDPKWRGRSGDRLVLEVQADRPNELVVVLTRNFFRPYRGRAETCAAVVQLSGGAELQTVNLSAGDFESADGQRLTDWSEIDLLSLRAYTQLEDRLLGSRKWQGPQPRFHIIRWERAGERS